MISYQFSPSKNYLQLLPTSVSKSIQSLLIVNKTDESFLSAYFVQMKQKGLYSIIIFVENLK